MKEIEALAKIKILISDFFQKVGRGIEDFEDIEELRQDLIDDIETILDKMKIPKKYLIMEKFIN